MKKRAFIALLLNIVLAAALFAQSDSLNFVQSGTATHELESEDFVAAHAILPIGQEVLVTDQDTGAQVTVTISERISPSNSRIIDLSSAAAATMAIFDDTAQVTIEATLVRNEPAAPEAADAPETPAPAPTPAAPETPAPATAQAAPATRVPAAPETRSSAAAQAPTTRAPAATPAPTTPPATSAPAPAAAVAEAVAIPSPPSTGYTPTSEITPVVPPWETDSVRWPEPQSNSWLPELPQPWIAGIEREQKPRTFGPAQTQTLPPALAFPPVSSPPMAAAPLAAPSLAPAQSGPSARVIPQTPGARDSALYRVQVGAFSARINAREAFDRLLNAGFSPVFEVQGGLTRVQIPWVRGYEVQTLSRRLYIIGFREVWIRTER